MAIVNATDVVLSVTTLSGLEAMAHSTSASLSMSMDLRDKTSKSSAGWQENLGGLKSWEMSGDSFVEIGNISGKADIEELFTVWNTGDAITVNFGATGMVYSGQAIITSMSIDAGVEENATYSISLTGSGPLVKS